jgi:type I restriction enzyme S subunit
MFSGRCLRLRAKPDKPVDGEYLYYWFCLEETKNTIRNLAVGSTMPSLNTTLLSNLEIDLPDLATQREIAATLRAFDDKIAVNNRLNHNLEQQCFALYRHYFTDEASPEWRIGTISDLGEVVGGSTPSKAKPEYYTEHGIAWITPKDLSVSKSKFIAHGADDITELGLRNSSARLMPRGTVLFSSRAPIGYIAIASGEVCTNQGFKSIVPHPKIGTGFVYYFLKDNLHNIERVASGSTFKEISGAAMKGVAAFVPDGDTLSQFNCVCEPILAQQETLELDNYHLATTRDSLLPKLMSGELAVNG